MLNFYLILAMHSSMSYLTLWSANYEKTQTEDVGNRYWNENI